MNIVKLYFKRSVNTESKIPSSPILQKTNEILYIFLPYPLKVIESKNLKLFTVLNSP